MNERVIKRTLSGELGGLVGETASVSGWLHKQRAFGALSFLLLRDRQGLIQIVVSEEAELQKLKGLQPGSVLSITGRIMADARAPQGVELHEPSIKVDVPISIVSPIELDKPIDHRAENLETLFEYRVLGIRNPCEQGIWRIQASVGDALRGFLKRHDFTEFHSPKLLAEATEGGAEVFRVDYFGRKAVLAQSAQFYKQILVGSLERVFEFGATYRAEPSVTSRHMTEFVTVDAEMGFIGDFQEVLELIGQMIRATVAEVWSVRGRELKMLQATPPVLADPFPQVALQKLHELCFQETGKDFRGEKDPAPFEERWICEYAAKHWSSEAVFITGFPATSMKFYHYQRDVDSTVAERADLIFRGVEIITGSQREHRYERLVEQLRSIGGNPEHPGYKYYLQAFRHGMPPHAGFGLGLERLTQKLIGFHNVKEATLFPRDMSRLVP